MEPLWSPSVVPKFLFVDSIWSPPFIGIMVGLWWDYMWTPGGFQVGSTWTPWTLRYYRCSPGAVQVYSSKTPWMLPGVQVESRWSPPQPVAQYNDLLISSILSHSASGIE